MIDAHHHIWRQADLPWLLGPERPRIFGKYASIKRDYLIDEYLADIKKTDVHKSVYVQANWAPNWATDEAAWVQSVADDYSWPHAIVAYADLTVSNARPQLERLKRYPLLRGIRQQLHWHENPLYCFAHRSDVASEKIFQRNVALLAEYQWSFDLQVFASQAHHAVSLARACPEVTLVLQHAGMLEDTSETGWRRWQNAMEDLADCENVVVKLSGLGTFTRSLDIELMYQICEQTLQIFGVNRCLFGSNFPIEKIWTTYDELYVAMKTVTANLAEHEIKAVFNDNAERVYRL